VKLLASGSALACQGPGIVKYRTLVAGCLLVTFAFVGCGSPTQISPSNRKLLQALQSAASAKQKEWLNDVETKVNEKHKKQEMSDAEFNAFQPIIKKAKAGDWKRANLDALALCNGQHPTQMDLENLKARKTAKERSD
jgi:hypothetical protein